MMDCARTEDDFTFPSAARRRAEDIMVEQKATYYIQIFSGAFHGFATRPDPSRRADREYEQGRFQRAWQGSVLTPLDFALNDIRMGEGGERAGGVAVVWPPR